MARWYCPLAKRTFSLLPDCLSARLRGSLDEVERVVAASEQMGVAAVAQDLRMGEIELPAALRWLRRRRRGVRTALLALLTLLPGRLGTVPEVRVLRVLLDTERALVALRSIGAEHLPALPAPLGFRPPPTQRGQREQPLQHGTGPDPPPPQR